jgi:hypothetical protein
MGIFNKLFGSEKKQPQDMIADNNSAAVFDRFSAMYPPSSGLVKPAKEMLEWYTGKLPAELLDFWVKYGFGNYGDGLIKIVEPSDYMDSFYTWTGKKDFSRLPILVTGFGDIFYYRRLSDTEEDVSLLNIHYRNISVCEHSLKDFFERYIIDEELSAQVLKIPLFKEAYNKLGGLTNDEIYFFSPALVLGGGEDIKYIDKGNSSVHQRLLFESGK